MTIGQFVPVVKHIDLQEHITVGKHKFSMCIHQLSRVAVPKKSCGGMLLNYVVVRLSSIIYRVGGRGTCILVAFAQSMFFTLHLYV